MAKLEVYCSFLVCFLLGVIISAQASKVSPPKFLYVVNKKIYVTSIISHLLDMKTKILVWFVLIVQPKTWCIVQQQAPGNKCQPYLDDICKQEDCSAISPGGPCYEPNTICQHTSYVLNLWWQHRRICDDQIATVTQVDPCK